jgi:type IV pilus assembly protein PilM
MSILESLTESIKSAMKFGGGGKNVSIGVDVGSSSLKIVQLKKSGGQIVLETYGEIAMGPYVEKQIGEIVDLDTDIAVQALKDVSREAHVTASAGGISIQSSASLIFVLNLPAAESEDLQGIVMSEARKYIPVPITEVSLDWWVVPRPELISEMGEDYAQQEVLVAALRNERLQDYKNIVAQSEMQSSFFEIEIFSAIRSTFGSELSSVMIVDFGASGTRAAIVQYGVVKRFHTIRRGSYQITEQIAKAMNVPFKKAETLKKEVGLQGNDVNGFKQVTGVIESNLNYIFSELKSIILRYEKEYNKAVAKIIFVGGGSRLTGLREYAEQEFTGEVEFGNPFQKTNHPEFLDRVLEMAGPEFAVAIGLALKELE